MINGFCEEIAGESNAPFNFEKELLNQAKVMEAHRLSSEKKTRIYLSEL